MDIFKYSNNGGIIISAARGLQEEKVIFSAEKSNRFLVRVQSKLLSTVYHFEVISIYRFFNKGRNTISPLGDCHRAEVVS